MSFAAIVGAGLVVGTVEAQETCEVPVGGIDGIEACQIGSNTADGRWWRGQDSLVISGDGATIVGANSSADQTGFMWRIGQGALNSALPAGIHSINVNFDGSVVVGTFSDEFFFEYSAFRWDADTGVQPLGQLNGYNIEQAAAISDDGAVIVGTSGGFAYRWVEGEGAQTISGIANVAGSEAYDVSGDGRVVVGSYGLWGGNGQHAFRWTEEDGFNPIATQDTDGYSEAIATNYDGSIIAGNLELGEGSSQAFRWTENAGVQRLGVLEGHFFSRAFDLSADGSTIVGHSSGSGVTTAFRWTEADGILSLGVLNGSSWSTAYSVNFDGSIIVGASGTGETGRVFIWREAGEGMEDYENLILSFPVLANDSAVAVAQSQFALGKLMDQTVFASDGKMAMSARAGLKHTERNPTHVGQRDTSLAALSFGYGLSDTVTVGASLGLNGTSLKNNAFDMKTGRNVALWGLYSEGGTARTGLQFGAAIGYGTSNGEIARGRLLTDVNLAIGGSDVTTKAFEARLGYGFELASGWLLAPSVTLAHFDTTRAGYTEAGASFNATYDAIKFSRTELTLAIEGEVKVGESGRMRIGGGIEQELNPKKPLLSGTTDLPALPTFDIEGDLVPNETRPFVTAGYTHDFGNGSSVTADVKLGRAVYGNSPDIGLGVGYGWKF